MYLIFFIVAIFIDQATKIWAINNLKGSQDIIIIDKWLKFTYVENSGAAWGIFSNGTLILVILTIAIIFGILFYLLKESNNIGSFYKLTLVMILAGAIGNLIDRIRLGYVIDFIFTPLGGLYNFPVFNLADVYVSIGAVLLLFAAYFVEGKSVSK